MKTILNTLYLMNQEAWLRRDGECVVVSIDSKVCLRVPIHTIGAIVCFGRIGCTTPLLTFCAERQLSITFLNAYGRFKARVCGGTSGNVLLRRAQYAASDSDEQSARIARAILIGKISNCRVVLQRALRDHAIADAERVTQVIRKMRDRLRWLGSNSDASLASLRGYEGEIAREYFSVFDGLIRAQKNEFCFPGRVRRPPTDPVNALLSFLYALLTNDAVGACETVGLDPQVGMLHRERPGRPSLALDLVEEFRPILADRLVLNLINRQQVTSKHLRQSESAAVSLTDEGRKIVLAAFQQRKQDLVTHAYLGEKMQFGLALQIQARLMAKCIRDELDDYPPFTWR